jgi:hypothetical protein
VAWPMLRNPNELPLKVANLKTNFTPLAIKTLPKILWELDHLSIKPYALFKQMSQNQISNFTNSIFLIN